MDRCFSVVIERQDGRTETLSFTGESPGAVFQQAKQMPGVRRVGKVAEINTAANSVAATRASGAAAGTAASGRAADPGHAAAPAPGRSERAGGYDPKVGFVLQGPRVVVHARPAGGEQPFRHLKAPPEQYGPPKPVKVEPPKVEAKVEASKPVAAKAPKAATPQAAEPTTSASPDAVAYRVMKSRRRDGQPYLLQRGSWGDAGGKRVFEAAWEKDFATREEAERHLSWLEQNEREMADVEHADADYAEADEADSASAELDYQAA